MAAYARRHYSLNTWRLESPRLIVEHYTSGTSFQSAWYYFAADGRHLGELPGVCAHFIIDTDGTIYQVVPLGVMCRHVIGLNWTAIGIEHVGTSDQQILNDSRQLRSSFELTLWLMWRFRIPLGNVIGHAQSLTSPFYKELDPAYRCQTHSDWLAADMAAYRRELIRWASSSHYRLPAGPLAPRIVSNGC